jgi:hypothetical protein
VFRAALNRCRQIVFIAKVRTMVSSDAAEPEFARREDGEDEKQDAGREKRIAELEADAAELR